MRHAAWRAACAFLSCAALAGSTPSLAQDKPQAKTPDHPYIVVDGYKVDPNIGAIYGHVAADLTVTGLTKTGPELTTDSFVKGLESIRGYHDIFNGPEVNFAADQHQGANSSFLAVVKGGRWTRLTDPLRF